MNFLLNEGGLGDQIARMPAISYVHRNHKHVVPIVWIPDYFIPVAQNMLPNIEFKPFSQNKEYDEKNPSRSTGARWFTNLKTHMVDHAFALLANEIPSIEHKNYLPINMNPIVINKFNLPKKFVVMTCGFTAPIREFLPSYVNQVNDYCISKGYKVVFLGKNETSDGHNHIIKGTFKEEIDFSKGLNLIDKTSLLEAAKIMSKAKCIIGLDNGLCHLAACSDVPIVCGYTSVDPIHRMPVRNNIMGWNWYNVIPPDSEPEKFFQSRIDFQFQHDFRFSYYNNDNLIKSVTPNLYINELDKIL